MTLWLLGPTFLYFWELNCSRGFQGCSMEPCKFHRVSSGIAKERMAVDKRLWIYIFSFDIRAAVSSALYIKHIYIKHLAPFYISLSQLLWMMLLRTWEYQYLLILILFSSDTYPQWDCWIIWMNERMDEFLETTNEVNTHMDFNLCIYTTEWIMLENRMFLIIYFSFYIFLEAQIYLFLFASFCGAGYWTQNMG